MGLLEGRGDGTADDDGWPDKLGVIEGCIEGCPDKLGRIDGSIVGSVDGWLEG